MKLEQLTAIAVEILTPEEIERHVRKLQNESSLKMLQAFLLSVVIIGGESRPFSTERRAQLLKLLSDGLAVQRIL